MIRTPPLGLYERKKSFRLFVVIVSIAASSRKLVECAVVILGVVEKEENEMGGWS